MPGTAWALLALVVLAGCGGSPDEVREVLDLGRLLPSGAELAGWAVSEGPVAHTPETLYEYLDGGAERSLSHGFHRLLHEGLRCTDPALGSGTAVRAGRWVAGIHGETPLAVREQILGQLVAALAGG